jgi:hypothetical protein
MRVIETSEDGKEVLLKVAVPTIATGWISTPLVPRASDEEAEMFNQLLAAKPEAAKPAPAKPDSPAVNPASETASNNQPQPPMVEPIVPETANQQSPEIAATSPPATATTAPETTPAAAADKPRETTLEDLERALKLLQSQPVETAEVMPLRDLYLEFAENHPKMQRLAETRARQLELWQTMQQKKLEVAAARDRMKMTAQETDAVRAALERSAEYTAVGRVAASTIYDGESLPKLFRLQDPATGRTIAYLKPDADYALANRIDVIVGIVGDKAYEDALRLNIITPKRVDTLAAATEQASGEVSEDK